LAVVAAGVPGCALFPRHTYTAERVIRASDSAPLQQEEIDRAAGLLADVANHLEMVDSRKQRSPNRYEVEKQRLASLTPPVELLALYLFHHPMRAGMLPVEVTLAIPRDRSELCFAVEDFEVGSLSKPVEAVLVPLDDAIKERFAGRAVEASEHVSEPIYSMHP
jgi:hypothetical protein